MENQESRTVAIWKKVAIGIVAFIGFLTTIKLAIIYYNANFVPNAPASFCSINKFIDCDSVAKTVDSQFLGVPLAFWGMFLYFFIGLLMSSKKLSQYRLFRFLEVFKNPYSYISALGIISFTISIILLCISLFQIKKLCILCAFTYVLNLIIGLFAMDYSKGGFVRIFKDSVLDLFSALKIKKYLIAFVAVMLCAVGFLTYSTVTYKFAPHVKKTKSIQHFVKLREKQVNPYEVRGNILGVEHGDVKITIFSDYRCPICSVYNIIVNKVISELDNVEVHHRNYPLDQECNKYLTTAFHQGACALAKYAEAAELQGNYWGFASEIYLRQPLTDYDVWMIAIQQGLDLDKLKADVEKPEIAKKILKDIDDAVALDVKGTPVIFIEGQKEPLVGAMTDFELKEALIKAGAKEKKHAK